MRTLLFLGRVHRASKTQFVRWPGVILLGFLLGTSVLTGPVGGVTEPQGATPVESTREGMKKEQNPQTFAGLRAQELRQELQESTHPDMRRRRGIILLSLVGIVAMALIALFQTGLIEHLPDPPLASFNSEKVNSSDTAFRYGVPDGTFGLASLAINLPRRGLSATPQSVTTEGHTASCRQGRREHDDYTATAD